MDSERSNVQLAVRPKRLNPTTSGSRRPASAGPTPNAMRTRLCLVAEPAGRSFRQADRPAGERAAPARMVGIDKAVVGRHQFARHVLTVHRDGPVEARRQHRREAQRSAHRFSAGPQFDRSREALGDDPRRAQPGLVDDGAGRVLTDAVGDRRL